MSDGFWEKRDHMERSVKRLLRNEAYVFTAILLIFAAISAARQEYWIAGSLVAAAIGMLTLNFAFTRQRIKAISTNVQAAVDNLSKTVSVTAPWPIAEIRLNDGEILWHNRNLQKTLNTVESMVGERISDVFPEFKLDWLQLGKMESPEELQIRREGDLWLIEGKWLERLVCDINFEEYESRTYFDRQLRKSGLFDRLEQMAIDNRKSVEGINDVLKANDPAAYDHWQELLAGMSFLFDMIDFSIADINELLDRNGVVVKLEKFKEIEAARKICDEMSLKDFTRMHEAHQQLWMDESDRLWEHLKERCGVYRRKVDKWEAKHPAQS